MIFSMIIMMFKDIFAFDVKWNYKTISLLLFLVFVPNLLGMINISTPFGFKLHFFQLAVIVAAMIYGPIGGLMSGLFGSVFSAVMMNNPYIIIGNIILGVFAGIFVKHRINVIAAVVLAFAIQLPWIIITDYYLVHLPVFVIQLLAVSLLITNLIWASAAHFSRKSIERLIE